MTQILWQKLKSATLKGRNLVLTKYLSTFEISYFHFMNAGHSLTRPFTITGFCCFISSNIFSNDGRSNALIANEFGSSAGDSRSFCTCNKKIKTHKERQNSHYWKTMKNFYKHHYWFQKTFENKLNHYLLSVIQDFLVPTSMNVADGRTLITISHQCHDPLLGPYRKHGVPPAKYENMKQTTKMNLQMIMEECRDIISLALKFLTNY